MPRRVQDIIPREHRSIRDIPFSSKEVSTRSKIENKRIVENEIVEPINRSKSRKIEKEDNNSGVEISPDRVSMPFKRMPIAPPDNFEIKRSRIKFWKWPNITILVILLIIVAGYFASTYYSQATFTIVPKVVPVTVDNTYVAQGTSQNNGLSYDVITLKMVATTTVSATNGPTTNTKATGKVTLFNSYSASTVRLIAGTRLSGENGLIYRLSSSVVIPGFKKNGEVVTPGKINVNIVADQVGQKYNIPEFDSSYVFKIVAYLGSAKYTAIYAKPISSVTGGFSGVKKIVKPEDISSSAAFLKANISSELLKKAKEAVPADQILFDKNYSIIFGNPIIGESSGSTTTISLQGTIHGITLPKKKFTEAIVGAQVISIFSPFNYTSPGLESLDVYITNLKDFSPIKKGALVIHVKGDLKIVGTIPVEEIRNKLFGIPLSQTQDVFKSYSSVIESGSGELAPPWANIPTNPDRVKIIIQNP